MSLYWIWLLIGVLYYKTIKYNYVIDDNVKREGYMYDVPLTAPEFKFYFTRPSVPYRLFMIGMHGVNASIIYLLWGWCPALLYAVHPLGVWGTAWVTGNYYATAAYFTLIAYFVLHTFPNIWGALVAMPIYAAALNSTVCPISLPFILVFSGTPLGWTMFIPLGLFLKGKKFQTGLGIRKKIKNIKVYRDGTEFNVYRRFALMIKVMGRYTYPCFYPGRLGFFDGFGEGVNENKKVYDRYHSFDHAFWACLTLLGTVFIGGMMIHPLGTLWFFGFIALHSQFNLMGQFYAQRYLYLALVGLCVVVGTLLQPYPIVVACVATFLFIRTYLFVPAFKNMEYLWRNDIENYPRNPRVYNNCAQFCLQANGEGVPVWLINEIGHWLFKAEEMDPNSWEIQMNLGCFFARIGHLEECLVRTNRSIALLEPLGGLEMPLITLKKQRDSLEQQLKKFKEETKAKTEEVLTK
jgi:hypothetical protein